MALLKLAEDNPDIQYYEYRDYNFYNKYLYRGKFYLLGVRYTWYGKTFKEFTDRLNTTGFWGLRAKDKDLIIKNIPILKKFFAWKVKIEAMKDVTLRVEGHSVGIYTNDLSLLKTIANDINEITVEITEVKTSNYVGIKHFVKKPKHKFRVYMKTKRVDQEFAQSLKDSLARSKSLYPSPALKFWAQNASENHTNWRYRWTSSSHFIDYDDESTLSYLALLHGDMLGKRYKLERRPIDF